MSLILVLISLIAGLLIGAIGIGGVLLVPALTYIAGIDVHQAIPACMLSFLATGTIGLIVFARHGSIKWSAVTWLCVGAVPSAYLGSLALPSIPADLVMALIALLMVLAGYDAWKKSRSSGDARAKAVEPGRAQFVLIGFITGFGSAISGTGGPLILVPVLIYLGLPVLAAVGLSQAIQIPIAAFASIGNWANGSLDFELALTLSVALVIGTLVGAVIVHRLPAESIRKWVAMFVLLTGFGIALRLLAELFW